MKGKTWKIYKADPGAKRLVILAELSDAAFFRASIVKVAELIANELGESVEVQHGRSFALGGTVSPRTLKNPTLVHHLLTSRASHHIVSDSSGAALADLYTWNDGIAARVGQVISTWVGSPVRVLSNAGTPATLAAHRTVARRRPQRHARRNPDAGGGGWRSYGPGKFDSMVDSFLWSASMDGAFFDEELGESEGFGFYGLAVGGILEAAERAAKDDGDELTAAERDELRGTAAVIMSEGSQGFVGVDYYKTEKAARDAWKQIEAEYEAFSEGGDENPLHSRRRELSVPDQHRLKIARQTLRMNDTFARIMGGMTKDEARRVIRELTGRTPRENPRSARYRRFDPRSFRTIKSGRARVVVACPRGKYQPRNRRCAVGTKSVAVLTGKRGRRNPVRPRPPRNREDLGPFYFVGELPGGGRSWASGQGWPTRADAEAAAERVRRYDSRVAGVSKFGGWWKLIYLDPHGTIEGGPGSGRRQNPRRSHSFPSHLWDSTEVDTWFERDRQHVDLRWKDGQTIVEWWDEDVTQAVEDGFLDPRDYHGSAIEYAWDAGLIQSSARAARTARGLSRARRRNPRGGEGDPTAARELELFIENSAQLYRQQLIPILKNLWRKMQKGTYDHTKAVKLWTYLADRGAKLYAREIAGDPASWPTMFTPATRRITAASLADTYRTMLEAHEFDFQGPRENPRARSSGFRYLTQGGTGSRVDFSRAEVQAFKRRWPASGLPDRALWFEYDARGDVVDMTPGDFSEADASGALSALAGDGKAHLERMRAVGRRNPSAPLDRGRRLYRTFHGFKPARVRRAKVRGVPPALVKIGPLVRLDYLSAKQDHKLRRYYHHTKRPHPELYAGVDGSYHILGGKMVVTDRGLVN